MEMGRTEGSRVGTRLVVLSLFTSIWEVGKGKGWMVLSWPGYCNHKLRLMIYKALSVS